MLQHYALSGNKYRDLYWKATKRIDETFSQFYTRLLALFNYYVASRKADSVDKLLSLFISDKIKYCLPKDILAEVTKQERSDFFSAKELCVFADSCVQETEEAKSATFGPNFGNTDTNKMLIKTMGNVILINYVSVVNLLTISVIAQLVLTIIKSTRHRQS